MFCKICGTKVNENDAFCPVCGEAITVYQAQVQNQHSQRTIQQTQSYDYSQNQEQVYSVQTAGTNEAKPKSKLRLILLIIMALIIVGETIAIIIMAVGGDDLHEVSVSSSIDSDLVGTWGLYSVQAGNEGDHIGGELYITIDDEGAMSLKFDDRDISSFYRDLGISAYFDLVCGTDDGVLGILAQTGDGEFAVKASAPYRVSGDYLYLTVSDSVLDIANQIYNDLIRNEKYSEYDFSYRDMDEFAEILDYAERGELILKRY